MTKDFFVSYTNADISWAEWITDQLIEAGYNTTLAAWDFRPGDNFIIEMNQALQDAERIMAVLSDAYLVATYTQDEWSVGFIKDEARKKGRIVPVRVRKCEPTGLLSSIIYIDLVDLPVDKARDALIDGLRPRGRPLVRPPFPGPVVRPPFPGPAVFPGSLPPIWNIPRNRNLKFTGREGVLANLHEILTSRRSPALPQAIVGEAGVGKTQIAVEYAYRHAADYKVVWWLRSGALATDYASLARTLKLPEREVSDQNALVESVQQWLGENKKWLLVFDNVQNQAEVRDYLPPAGNGHILITSQNLNWQDVANALPVKGIDTDDAANFLLKRTE